ncbi:MAG: hypothetical protein Tsb0020_50810 [Haliangiales bacterium]
MRPDVCLWRRLHLCLWLALGSIAAASCAISPDVTPLPGMSDAGPGEPDATPPSDAPPPPPPDALDLPPDAFPGDGGFGPDAGPQTNVIGWDRNDGFSIPLQPDVIFLARLPFIDRDVLLDGWGIESFDVGAGTTVKMALYTDVPDGAGGSVPGELVAQSFSFPADMLFAIGNQELLAPGNYWLTIMTDSTYSLGGQSAPSIRCEVFGYPFDQPFPPRISDLPPPACEPLGTPESPTMYILVRDF